MSKRGRDDIDLGPGAGGGRAEGSDSDRNETPVNNDANLKRIKQDVAGAGIVPGNPSKSPAKGTINNTP